jgi:mono/diheme cytochrome c family protein
MMARAFCAALFLMAGVAQAADTAAGKSLFTERCGMCHQTNGMGVGLLSRRPGDTSKGLLENRTDLSAAVVKVVVRNGIVNMPRISRAEVSDPQLAAIADYLSRGKP